MQKVLLVALLTFQQATALSLSGQIFASANNTASVETLKVYLNGKFEARVDRKGQFRFDDLSPGKYLLSVPSVAHTFPTFELEAFASELKAFQIDERDRFYIPVALPLEIIDRGRKQYVEIKEGFNLQSFIKCPYGIMILVTLGLILCMKSMPKMEELQGTDRVERARNA